MNTKPNTNSKRRGFVIPVLIASLALVAVGLIIEATKTPPLKCPKDGAEMFINSGAGVALCPKCGYTYDLSKHLHRDWSPGNPTMPAATVETYNGLGWPSFSGAPVVHRLLPASAHALSQVRGAFHLSPVLAIAESHKSQNSGSHSGGEARVVAVCDTCGVDSRKATFRTLAAGDSNLGAWRINANLRRILCVQAGEAERLAYAGSNPAASTNSLARNGGESPKSAGTSALSERTTRILPVMLAALRMPLVFNF